MSAKTFRQDIEAAINKHSRENVSNTPDFILAEYIECHLQAFEIASNNRKKWGNILPTTRE